MLFRSGISQASSLTGLIAVWTLFPIWAQLTRAQLTQLQVHWLHISPPNSTRLGTIIHLQFCFLSTSLSLSLLAVYLNCVTCTTWLIAGAQTVRALKWVPVWSVKRIALFLYTRMCECAKPNGSTSKKMYKKYCIIILIHTCTYISIWYLYGIYMVLSMCVGI